MRIAHLSNVYRFTEQFGIMGHQIGRKVGDMLEVVTMASLYQDDETRRRMRTEPKVEGFTGAEHKVEFAFYNSKKPDRCIGLIECKKVGVEVTKHSKTKSGAITLKKGAAFVHTMRPDWVARPVSPKLQYNGHGKLRVALASDTLEFQVTPGARIKLIIDEEQTYQALGPGIHLATVSKNIGACHIFTARGVTDEELSLHIDTCLTGPQTIEKAKQIAWVALDVRKRECNHWGKEDVPEGERHFKAILVVGEASHWEHKSRQVIRSALDHNFIVADDLIVALFERFIKEFGQADFEARISKDKYAKDAVVQRIVNEVMSSRNGKILAELDSGAYHRILLRGDELIVDPIA